MSEKLVSVTESPGELWELLGSQYPAAEGPAHVRAAFDVLAVVGREGCEGHRWPVYEDENGELPTPDEVWSLATKVADAVVSAAKGATARCDACAGEARFTCICQRCDREPDVGEKYHACAEHRGDVSNKHGLVRGVHPRWKENAS